MIGGYVTGSPNGFNYYGTIAATPRRVRRGAQDEEGRLARYATRDLTISRRPTKSQGENPETATDQGELDHESNAPHDRMVLNLDK